MHSPESSLSCSSLDPGQGIWAKALAFSQCLQSGSAGPAHTLFAHLAHRKHAHAPAPTASRTQAQPHQVPSPGWPPLGIRPPLPLLRARTRVPDPNVLRRVSLQSSASSNCQKYTSKISISLKLPSEGSGSKGGKTHALEKGRGLTWRQQFSHFFFFLISLFWLLQPSAYRSFCHIPPTFLYSFCISPSAAMEKRRAHSIYVDYLRAPL